jgi:hypothetical protein
MWWCSPRRPGRVIALGLVTLLASGCAGYRWTSGGDAPEAVTDPVAVAAFTNATLEPYLGALLTATVRTRLLEGGVPVAGGASRRLAGRVTDFSDEVLAFDAAGIASHRRVVVTTELTLQDGDALLWDRRPAVVSAEYPVTLDTTRNLDAKDRALEEAAINLADGILLDFMDLPGAAPAVPPETAP